MNLEMIAAGSLETKPEALLNEMRQLRDNPVFGFDRLIDLTAVDRGETFELVYRLNSLLHDRDLLVRAKVSLEQPTIASVSEIWESALFGEREVHDMFGIVFEGHPELEPLLAPEEGFGFFPLRKSYTLPGRSGQTDGGNGR